MHSADPLSPLDRDALREVSRRWADAERRLVIERALEHLPDEALRRMLGDIVHLNAARRDSAVSRPLDRRIADHVEATRRGDFLGDLIVRNTHGHRERKQTGAWIAATAHLFDLALDRARDQDDDAALKALVALAEEVDERSDEFVVFEDSCAREELWDSLRSACSTLDGA